MTNYKYLLLFIFTNILIQTPVFSQSDWAPVEGKIMTRWANEVSTDKPLNEYPRPQMVRENWYNLNGLWDYAILPKEENLPVKFDGKILVPFAIESALSGVGKTVGKDHNLWYKTTFTAPKKQKGEKVLLHFGAVDWEAEVFINGEKAGLHQGGYDPFSFDITALLKSKGSQELVVRVWDPTDEGPQPRGKQVKRPEGIWYTPVTGIWQTVWLETVANTYISGLKTIPDIDSKTLSLKVNVENAGESDKVLVKALNKGSVVAEKEIGIEEEAILSITNMKLWSPEDPFLYDLEVSVLQKGKAKDLVISYFGMRKIALEKDENGIQKLMLNNEFLFQYGPLDQGWWPDGLYTAPTDEALLFDIEKTKEMGFNMIRKHVKVEPARWYNYCDKLGMLVWQDMPSGDKSPKWMNNPSYEGEDIERSKASENIYKAEWKEIMSDFNLFPSIVVWVPFNEAWGQFKTVEITKWTQEFDPTRLVNSASGGNYFQVGDILDLHHYPEPRMPRADIFGKDQSVVLGEFGGLGLPVEKHTWQEKDNWGYRSFTNKKDLTERYASYINALEKLIGKGLSAAVYTQTTDVEVEINGLMTYDREIIKVDPEYLKKIHLKLYR
ncbi:glycoside hydrolase family 2 protein [Flexithrix dorotheae]|uniref:glycoside hydrolase family 2 protein n=1 Tax=Flexithrix dorotheae TaxID=70993 RepID=UPI00036F631F|nr:glycoside hydrolase family 2 [Flexithrix dorotheae]